MQHNGWSAEQYKKHSSPQEDSGKYVIATYPFKGDEVVLDIGCGEGRTTAAIAAKVPRGRVVGIDPSASMIEEARKSFSAIKNLSFMQASAEDFKIDVQCDLVVSFHALHYVKDHLKVVKNIYRVLKPGGTFIALMGSGTLKEMVDVFSREPWKSLIGGNMQWHASNEVEYAAFLKEAGFTAESVVQTVTAPLTYAKKEDLLNWLLTWLPFATGLNTEQSIRLGKELVESLAKGKENDIVMHFPILYVKAQK